MTLKRRFEFEKDVGEKNKEVQWNSSVSDLSFSPSHSTHSSCPLPARAPHATAPLLFFFSRPVCLLLPFPTRWRLCGPPWGGLHRMGRLLPPPKHGIQPKSAAAHTHTARPCPCARAPLAALFSTPWPRPASEDRKSVV